MVVKPGQHKGEQPDTFESSVILNGSKTHPAEFRRLQAFESSVILNGSKTPVLCVTVIPKFESSVILNGSKTGCAQAF